MSIGEQLSELEESYRSEDYPRVVEFMLSVLCRIPLAGPPTALDGLRIATGVWSGKEPSSRLDAARVACWQHLDGDSLRGVETATARTLRAVICVLYPDPVQDVNNLLTWFLMCCEGLGELSFVPAELDELLSDLARG